MREKSGFCTVGNKWCWPHYAGLSRGRRGELLYHFGSLMKVLGKWNDRKGIRLGIGNYE